MVVFGTALAGALTTIVALLAWVYLDSSSPEQSVTYYQKDHELSFLEKLNEAGIPYRQDDTGQIWFQGEHSSRVDEIQALVREENRTPMEVYDQRLLTPFQKVFEENSIEYSITEIDGRWQIRFAKEDEGKANELLNEYMQNAKAL